jgi:hypothetical protein
MSVRSANPTNMNNKVETTLTNILHLRARLGQLIYKRIAGLEYN